VTIRDTARRVLKLEADAILRMRTRLDRDFGRAVRMMFRAKGPVIVIGMGKPAFIAQKISASLASTGTPSFSLHPADALHGDIGRVTRNSAVVVLSNSGQTEEIVKLLPLLRQTRCRLISITGNVNSTLGRAGDAVLDASVVSEARPLHVAPTASTTCMLAMGDALVMALVKLRGFREKDFAMLHPGGSLGKKLRLTVADVMRTGRGNPCVKPGTSIKRVLLKITQAHAGSVTVVDGRGRCAGIFTDGDLRRQFDRLAKSSRTPVSEFMTSRPTTVREDTLAVKAMEILRRKRVDELPVVNARGKVTGLLDVQDLLARGFVLSDE